MNTSFTAGKFKISDTTHDLLGAIRIAKCDASLMKKPFTLGLGGFFGVDGKIKWGVTRVWRRMHISVCFFTRGLH
jgi:hypothetical protein